MAVENTYWWPWEKDAQNDREMPDGLSLHDQQAYTAIRNVYRDYHRREIDREKALREKRKIYTSYSEAVETEGFNRKLAFENVRRNNAMQNAISAYRKCKTIANADRVVDIWDGLERPVAGQ